MTHAEASMKTKQAMADSLKRYMEVKSLSKITISAICEDCGINRKTFYYHFKDIYDLLKWTLEQESLVVVNQLDVMVDYEKSFLPCWIMWIKTVHCWFMHILRLVKMVLGSSFPPALSVLVWM